MSLMAGAHLGPYAGSRLAICTGHRWYSTRVITTPELRWDPPHLVFDTPFTDTPCLSYDISPDGHEVVFERVQERSDVVLLDLPQL